jgi:hypothetical protein
VVVDGSADSNEGQDHEKIDGSPTPVHGSER